MQNISFKGCIPVEFFAKHPVTQKYVPIVKYENIKKCKSFVVRNLNHTLKEANQNDIFINAYKKVDSDYAKTPFVRSIYDKYAPVPKSAKEKAPCYVYLFTGQDADSINQIGKQLGKEKFDIFERTGKKQSSEIDQAKNQYRRDIRNLINKICPRVKDEKGNKLVMRIFFEPEYNKKGDFKRFAFQDVIFYPQEDGYNL